MSEDVSFKDILMSDHPDELMRKAAPFLNLMMKYECAIMEVETKFNVINNEFSTNHNRNPIESIKTRLKEPLSIIEKMKRKGFPITMESMEENLFDIAGIRVICPFIDDIYILKKMLLSQDDIKLIQEKDYIKNPKENGYRSLHIIIEVPVFLSSGKSNMKAEVQLRTMAMDLWASLEHKLKYKKNIDSANAESIAQRLKACAVLSSDLDIRMQEIRNDIDSKGSGNDEDE